MKQQNPTERESGKDGESQSAPKAETAAPIERFKSLARRLINVPRDELEKERERDKVNPSKLRKIRRSQHSG